MRLYVLDTDHVSLLQKDHAQIVQRVSIVGAGSLAVTVITVEEQLRGWFQVIRRNASGSKLIWAYAGLRGAVEYFNSVRLLDFDQGAEACYVDLRRQKIRIGTQDLRIAAIALSVNAILVTRNRRYFEKFQVLCLKTGQPPSTRAHHHQEKVTQHCVTFFLSYFCFSTSKVMSS